MVKKGFLFFLFAALVASGVFAQSWYNSYAPGIDNRVFFNAGAGLGSTRGFTVGIPPLQVSLDFKLPVNLPITIGATGIFSTWGYDTYYVDITYINIGIGSRGMYHFNFTSSLDIYTGLTLGWVIQSASVTYSSSTYRPEYSGQSFLFYGGNIGARYFFTNFFGVYLELGYSSLAFGTVGVTLKFGSSGRSPGDNIGEIRSGNSEVISASNQTGSGGRFTLAEESDFTVTIGADNRSAVITRYNGQGGIIVLPVTIQRLPVLKIGEGAFRGNNQVIGVVIPEGVTEIGENVFSDCYGLTSIALPSTIKSIGTGAFNGCRELVEVIIPPGVTMEWHGDIFAGNARLLLSSQALLRQLGYTGSF